MVSALDSGLSSMGSGTLFVVSLSLSLCLNAKLRLFERWIICYPADSVVCFVNTHPMDSNLSCCGLRYPVFKQPGPGV